MRAPFRGATLASNLVATAISMRCARVPARPAIARMHIDAAASTPAVGLDAPTGAPAAPLPPLPSGLLVAHKPQNWTSFDVCGKIRSTLEAHLRRSGHQFRARRRLKVGHGGTLDPLAEGMLVVGVGGGCKVLSEYLAGAKGYVAQAQLGLETDTQDATGATIAERAHTHVTEEALRDAAAALTGTIMQRPPIYSALRKDGKRMHELARRGEVSEDDVEPREVTVHVCDIRRFDPATGRFELAASAAPRAIAMNTI